VAEPFRLIRGGEYVPKWGNAARADADKIRVHFHFLTFEEQQRFVVIDGDAVRYDEVGAVASMVDRIDNLSVVYDGEEEVKIATGADLLKGHAGLDSLALEVWAHVRSQSAVDKKK
jgi:hypothetical protein